MCRTLYSHFIAKPFVLETAAGIPSSQGDVYSPPSGRWAVAISDALMPMLAGEVTHHFGEAKQSSVPFPYGGDGAMAPETGAIRPNMPAKCPSRPLSYRALQVFLRLVA